MSDDGRVYQPMAVRRLSDEDADAMRVKLVSKFLTEILQLKQKLNAAQWQNIGGPEFENFVEALLAGVPHPVLADWNNRIERGNPGLPPYEQRARRRCVLLVIALRRSVFDSLGKARQYAARELNHAGVFSSTVTAKKLEHWQDEIRLTPDDEQMMANAIAVCSRFEPHKLCLYFIGMVHIARNPTAVVVHPDN